MAVIDLNANIDPSYYRLLSGQERGRFADVFQAKRPSVAERLAAGKALRERVPRTNHDVPPFSWRRLLRGDLYGLRVAPPLQ